MYINVLTVPHTGTDECQHWYRYTCMYSRLSSFHPVGTVDSCSNSQVERLWERKSDFLDNFN